MKNPSKRNLQKKHRLEWTTKARLLLVLSLPGFIPLISFFSPIFLILSQILIRPLEYYQKEKILTAAKNKLAKLSNLKIVAITGSYGKTSTKDMLYTLLFKKYFVVKTPKSFNTPLGVAQTILDYLKSNTDILIAEIGAYKRGEIKNLTKFLKPKIGVITAVAPQHLERFGSLENIAKAKFELVENLPQNGIAILNNESDLVKNLASHMESGNVNFYGTGSQYYASDIKVATEGTSFIFHTPKTSAQITIPLTGEHHAKNFVAAATVALNLGLTLNEIKERATKLLPTPHRLEIKKQNGLTLIDNTYNTNPQSSKSSLRLLHDISGSQKILITPGLVEQGRESSEANQEFAKEAAKVSDQIIIVGEYAKKDLLAGLSTANFPKKKIFTAGSFNEAMNILGKISKPETVVLLENDLPDQYS